MMPKRTKSKIFNSNLSMENLCKILKQSENPGAQHSNKTEFGMN